MENNNFRIEYFEVNGNSVVKFHTFAFLSSACDYAITSVMVSKEFYGVVVSMACGDFYNPIMKFDVRGLDK